MYECKRCTIVILNLFYVFEHDSLLSCLILTCIPFFFQLNPDVNVFQRKFVNEVRRCEEMDRKLSKWA